MDIALNMALTARSIGGFEIVVELGKSSPVLSLKNMYDLAIRRATAFVAISLINTKEPSVLSLSCTTRRQC